MIIDVTGTAPATSRLQSVVEVASGRSRPALPDLPLETSATGPWQGFVLEHHASRHGFDQREVFSPDHLVIIPVGTPPQLEWKENGDYRRLRIEADDVVFLPAATPFSLRSTDCAESVGLAITPAFLRCAAHDLYASPEPLAFEPRVPAKDPFLTAALGVLRDEMRAGYPGGRRYGETIATAIAAHLVRHYASPRPRSVPLAGARLSRHQLHETLEYIQEHLAEEIPLRKLAALAGLSPYHFCRVFKHTTGLSPHRYLIQQRVERARQLLLSGSLRIAEVAARVGFCDQSHLTAHFRRHYGVTPRSFRSQAPEPER